MATFGSNEGTIAHPTGAAAAPRGHERPGSIGLWVCAASVALLSCATLAFATLRPVQVLPFVRPVPPVSLRDADGGPVTLAPPSGAIVVLQFSVLNCAAPCEDGHQALQRLQQRLAVASIDPPVHLVSVVLDGQQDPQALSALRTAMAADPRWWRLATGDAAQLRAIVGGGFGVYYAQDRDGRIALDPATMLVDGRGIVRAEYRTAAPDAGLIWRDIGLIAREASSRGAARSLYAAAHLFLCYPR